MLAFGIITFVLLKYSHSAENAAISTTCNCEQLSPSDKVLTCKFPFDITDGKRHVRAYCGDAIQVASCPHETRENKIPCVLVNASLQYISHKTLSLKTWIPGNTCSCRAFPEQSGHFEDCVCTRSKTYGIVVKEESNANVGLRVGIIFGGFILICLIVFAVFLICQRREKKNKQQPEKQADVNGLPRLDGGDAQPEIMTCDKAHLVQAGKSPIIIPDIIADGEVIYPDDVVMLNIPYIDAS